MRKTKISVKLNLRMRHPLIVTFDFFKKMLQGVSELFSLKRNLFLPGLFI